MTPTLTLSEIEVRWRASNSGVCVIVEGETEIDDPWFYNRWFGSRAREVTFFPQDGWQRVLDAVAVLRATCGPKCVYGIIDRDFEPVLVHSPFPGNGVLRTRKYTLENYLLDPECWFRYIQPHTVRMPRPGWNSPEEIRLTIEGLYRECLPLSALNWTLRQARALNNTAFIELREADREFREHPKAIERLGNIPAYLRDLQQQMRLPDDLGQIYAERLAYLQSLPMNNLEETVSGKYVLRLLRERFPLKLSGNQAWDDVLGAYLYGCPDPHPDLVQIVDLILQDAHA